MEDNPNFRHGGKPPLFNIYQNEMNIEYRSVNIEHEKRKLWKKYDLEERLLEFSANVIRLTDRLPNSRAGTHVSNQLIRSGTSPYANHGEAQGAESQKDFIHKMGICLKELWESERWLKLILKVPLISSEDKQRPTLLGETVELIRIFVVSIKTAKSHL